jgi:pimeloyl-ACP methyl ester carboxylesterase
MSGRALRGLAVAVAFSALAGAGLAAAPASAALSFGPCPEGPGFECATVAVPLDRSGRVPGTIPLSVERRTASGSPLAASQTAVLALAGGPGQAADPLAGDLAKAIAPALTTRDMLVFDQRGTGKSSPLSCPIFSDARALAQATEATIAPLVEQCALQIGPARGAFTTAESVEDIEAVRHAAGYRKLVLYGTSYGTKVALQYAERYPQRVEALVLDSVVPPEGPEPFEVASFEAIGPALSELCAARACAGITPDALRDLGRLTARLRARPLGGSAYDGRGHRHSVSLDELDLLLILEVGDVNPALRALLPAAVHAALAHDPDPLLRLKLLAEGFIPSIPTQPPDVEAEGAGEEQGNALFTATSCEETRFPWQRSAPAATRHAEALAALRAIPSGLFYPFDPATALHAGRVIECEGWPDASPGPAPTGALPAVPALLLSGAQDLRTPSFNAREVAARIPGAQVLVVPHTGHSVLGSDFSGCAEAAVASFFTSGTVQPCPASHNLFAPTPVPPHSLIQVHTPPGLPGRAGRTLTAAIDAIVDLDRQVIAATLQAEQELPSGSSFGGLRGGYARLTASAAILKRFSFIAGVQLSGRFPVRDGQLQPATIRISGPRAAHGTVTFSLRKRVTGTLGGRHFNVSLARVRLSAADALSPWPPAPRALPLARLIDRHRALR